MVEAESRPFLQKETDTATIEPSNQELSVMTCQRSGLDDS